MALSVLRVRAFPNFLHFYHWRADVTLSHLSPKDTAVIKRVSNIVLRILMSRESRIHFKVCNCQIKLRNQRKISIEHWHFAIIMITCDRVTEIIMKLPGSTFLPLVKPHGQQMQTASGQKGGRGNRAISHYNFWGQRLAQPLPPVSCSRIWGQSWGRKLVLPSVMEPYLSIIFGGRGWGSGEEIQESREGGRGWGIICYQWWQRSVLPQ